MPPSPESEQPSTTKRSRRKAALLASSLLGVGLIAVTLVFPLRDPEVRAAEELARTFEKRVELPRLKLWARVPASYVCSNVDVAPFCRGDDWSVTWAVEAEARPQPTAELVAAAKSTAPQEENGFQRFLGRATVAGYDGYLADSRVTRRPGRNIWFSGWRSDAAGERRHLTIRAESGVPSSHTEGPQAIEALAVVLATAE